MANWFKEFLFGSPEKHDRVSTLSPEQEQVLQNLMASLQGQGAGGAFGSAADYWYQILQDNPELMEQFMAPDIRRFKQETIPGLSEQFAGMGSGGLTSSGFRNSAVQAGTDLQERLANIRAQLKQQAAGGLSSLGQMGLGNYTQDVMTQGGTQGIVSPLSQGLGQAFGQGLGGWANSAMSKFGKSNPYGNQGLTR